MTMTGKTPAAAGPPDLGEILESAGVGLMVLDRDWRITYVNAAAEDACGAPRGQLLGASYWEARVDLGANELLRNVMGGGAPARFESQRASDRWLEIEAYPLADGGLACCMRDISERKRVEEGHRQLQRERDELLAEMQLRFQRMPIACAIVGLDGRILDWNPAAEKLLGFTREEAIGKNGYELVVAPASRASARERVSQLAQGDMEAHGFGENLTKDGRVVSCEWFNTPLRALDGTVTRFLTMGLDVTAQREAERRLKKSEALMAEAQRLARIGSFSRDLRTNEVSLSEESYRLLGLEPSQAQGLTFDRILASVHPDDAATMQATIARALQDHQPFDLDWRLFRPDGRVRFVHSRAHVELDEAGVPIRVFGTNQDVTEQKAAEQALIESEARFRALADASPALIWAVDQDENIVYINSRYNEMIGVPMDEFVGGRWPTMIHPEDVDATITNLRTALRDRGAYYARNRVRRYDQTWRWLESRALPHFGKDGHYLGLVGISIDITEHLELTASLQESEKNAAAELGAMARLQDVSTKLVQAGDSNSLLQEIVNAAIAITASDAGNIQLVEPDGVSLRMVASHGLDQAFIEAYPRVEIGKGTCGYAMQIGERVIVEDVLNSVLFAGLDMTIVIASGIRAIQSTPLITRSGHLVGMLSTHYRSNRRPAERDLRVLDLLARQAADWIERRMAQAERERLLESERQARAESERAARLKDEFLATLSHELRTPLSAIVSWADVLSESYDNRDRVRRGLGVIRRNAWAQAQLIGDLLDLSRVVTGKMRVNVEQVALSAVIDSAIEAVRPAADARAIEIRSTVEPLTAPVHGDPARLRQIMWNLLSNAVKFTPEGGRVDVVLARVDSWVEIRVTDTGKGISSDFLPHVFERFRQADSSTAREHGGLGIGLALVKQIAELHGGHVRASSPGEGMGSSFVLSLPLSLARARSADEEPRAPRAPATSPPFYEAEEPPLDGIKVLVVDDEPDALEVIQNILEDRRAQVATFSNVDTALRALERERFDVLVSDIGMPRRDGYDFIAEVRRRGIKTPAAALSAFARSEDRTRALLSGYQAHLAKPLATSELLATVASLSGRILR